MFGQDSSPLITYAIPFFMFLVGIEFIYGLIKRENNYRINDALTSMSLGLISRFIPYSDLMKSNLLVGLHEKICNIYKHIFVCIVL